LESVQLHLKHLQAHQQLQLNQVLELYKHLLLLVAEEDLIMDQVVVELVVLDVFLQLMFVVIRLIQQLLAVVEQQVDLEIMVVLELIQV